MIIFCKNFSTVNSYIKLHATLESYFVKLHEILAEIESLCALTKITCNFSKVPC
jgi:hypothetical protein